MPDKDKTKSEVFKQTVLQILFSMSNYEVDFKEAVPSIGLERYITEIYKNRHEIKVISNEKYHVEYTVLVVKDSKCFGKVAFRIKLSNGKYTRFTLTMFKEDEFIKAIRNITSIGVSFKYNRNYVIVRTDILKKKNMHDVQIIYPNGREVIHSVFIPPLAEKTPDVKVAIIDYIHGHNKKTAKALRIPKNRKIKK